jgi:hypothetical protein
MLGIPVGLSPERPLPMGSQGLGWSTKDYSQEVSQLCWVPLSPVLVLEALQSLRVPSQPWFWCRFPTWVRCIPPLPMFSPPWWRERTTSKAPETWAAWRCLHLSLLSPALLHSPFHLALPFTAWDSPMLLKSHLRRHLPQDNIAGHSLGDRPISAPTVCPAYPGQTFPHCPETWF